MRVWEFFEISEGRADEIMEEIVGHCETLKKISDYDLLVFVKSKYTGNEEKFAIHFAGYIFGVYAY